MASNTVPSSTCGLCSQLYSDPRMLQCLHSFCKKCLEKEFEKKETKSSLKCPTCKKECSIPDGGIETLQKDLRKSYEAEIAHYEEKVKGQAEIACDQCIEVSNGPAISFCCNCCEFLCSPCAKHHKTWRKTLNHELVEVGESKTKTSGAVLKKIPRKPMNCPLHEDETLKFYCEGCETLICRDCAVLEHSGHKYNRVEKVAENEKKALLSTLEMVNSVTTKLDDAMAQGEKAIQRVQAKQKTVDEDIERTFKALYKAVQAREKEFLDKSKEIAVGRRTALGLQIEELKKIRDEISDTSKMVTEATQSYTPAEMLSAKGAMAAKLQDLLKQFENCNLEPCRNEVVYTSLDSEDLSREISKFGEVIGGSSPASSTVPMDITSAVVGKKRNVLLTARDSQGKPFLRGGEKIRVTLSLMGSGDPPLVGDVIDKDDGTYDVSFTPAKSGEHELAITIGGAPIKGSPFVISVREPRDYSSLSASQRQFDVSSNQYGVAVDDNGDVYVALYGNHSVSVFDKNGTNIRTIGTPGTSGSGEGQFNSPSAIAIRGDVIYVAEQSNHRVQKLTKTGKFISKFGSNGSGDGQLYCPRGICLDHDGQVYVSECNNNRVSVFSPDGIFARHITGNLKNPWDVAFDPTGYLHVANCSSNSISVFTKEGAHITEYGSGLVQSPAGIAVNEEGYSFISEWRNPGRFVILDDSHQLVKNVQTNIAQSCGVALDKEGFVYISEYSNKRVLKY